MKSYRFLAVVALLFAIGAGVARADVVVFKNGDRLTGTIVAADGGKLTVKTDTAGPVTLDLKDVQSFSSEAPISITLKDGSIIKATKVEVGDAGKINVSQATLAQQAVALDQIDKINPPPVAWTGSVVANGMIANGNTRTDSAGFSMDLTRKTDTDKIAFDAGYQFTRSSSPGQPTVTSADNWFGDAQYDLNITKKFYGYADTRVEKDRINNLDLRLTPGVGVGYNWFATPDFNLSTEGGATWVYENFTNVSSPREDMSLRLNYHIDKSFQAGKFNIFNDVTYFPSIQNSKNYLVIADAGGKMALTEKMFTELQVLLDFDSNPAPGAVKTNTKFLLGVGWAF
jgi:putative salt-induced outer membrane protein YdiY